MEYGELINDFVDGNLGATQEDQLFVEMASNQGLRSELKQFIEFERTARFDSAAYSPSAETTASIFSRVGITNPAFVPTTAATTGFGIGAFLGKYSQGIIGGVVMAILTSSIMYFTMISGSNAESGVRSQKTEIRSQNTEGRREFGINKNLNSGIPVVSSEEKTQPKIIERVIIKYVDRPVLANADQQTADGKELGSRNEELGINNAENVAEEKSNLTFASVTNLFSKPKDNITINSDDAFNMKPLIYGANEFIPGKSLYDYLGEIGVSLEISGSDYWMFPSAKETKSSEAMFENKKLAVILNISENFQFGIELRQESFYYEYNTFITDNEYFVRQHNNYYSGGLLARWIPIKFEYLSPFAQAMIGGNQAGPIGRLMMGTIISPSKDYSFIFAVEGSGMLYNHNNNWLTSKKIGLHYGMLFNF